MEGSFAGREESSENELAAASESRVASRSPREARET
jgi:hypothetical protein